MNLIYFLVATGTKLAVADPSKYPKDPFDAFPLEHETPPDIVTDNRFLGEFFYMLLMLGMLIGVVLAAGYFLRRLTSSRIEALNTSSRIKIMETRSLSQRSQVYLIEVDEKEYLVAENHAAISVVAVENPCTDRDESV
jgi:hypothetical protein